MSTPIDFDNAKLAVALRTARAAIGWNQQEFAELMGVAKSTVARIETMEMAARGDFILKAVSLFKKAGINIELFSEGFISIQASDKAIQSAATYLQIADNRRSDRKPDGANEGLLASAGSTPQTPALSGKGKGLLATAVDPK